MSKPTCTNSPTSSSVWDSISSGRLRRARRGVGSRGLAKKHNGTQRDGGYANRELRSSVSRYQVIFLKTYTVAVIAVRIHLFPFRTEKLSSPSPMVLPHQVGEEVAATFLYKVLDIRRCRGLFAYNKVAEFNPQSSSTTAPRGISALPGPVTS